MKPDAAPPPDAVVDTQMIIRGLHTARGASGGLMTALAEGRFRLVTSEPLLEELRRSLAKRAVQRLSRRGPLSSEAIDELVDTVRELAARVVPGRYEVTLVPKDPKDNPVVACALEGGAAIVVTDDRKHLLPLKVVRVSGFDPVQIVTPTAFLEELRRHA